MLVFEGHAMAGAMPVSVACTDSWDHGDIRVYTATEDYVWALGPATARVGVDVHG